MPRPAHASPTVAQSHRSTSDAEWLAECDRCGAAYTLSSWVLLAMVARVESEWLATHVTSWRDEAIIEVRRCARCETAMSRRRPATTAERT